MPSGPGFLQSGEAVGDSQGPNASLESGQATQLADLQRQSGILATGPGGPPGAPAGTEHGPPQQAPPVPAPHPVQPPPQRPPLTPDTVNGQVFSPPQQVSYPYAAGLMVAAMHPSAGPYIRALAEKAKQGFGRPPQPGQ